MAKFQEQDNESTHTGSPREQYSPALRNKAFLSQNCTGRMRQPVLGPETELDRFRIIRHLGSGSLGDVYLSYDDVRHQEVAIKVVDVGPLNPPLAATQLRREMAVYNRIQDHRHVLKVYDIHLVHRGGTELLVLSMEYADGGSLREWMQTHLDDWDTRRTQGPGYFKQVCQGLKAVHDADVTHLDLKPENILFVNDLVKISDFGVSAIIQALAPYQDSTLECPNSTDEHDFGTPTYMPREYFTAPYREDLDARSDIYSAGAIFYEILHPKGRPPYGGGYRRLREMHTQAPIPLLPQVGEIETRIVYKCLQKDPADRYQSVGDLLDDLEGRSIGQSHNPHNSAEKAWQQVCRCVEGGEFLEAQRHCRQILTECPTHDKAKSLQEELQERYQSAEQLYAAIEQGLNDYNLEELITLLDEAVDTYPDHLSGRVIQVRLAVKVRQYRQTMEEGMTAIQDGDWDQAVSCFEKGKQLNPGGQEAENAKHFVSEISRQVEEYREIIDEATNAGNGDRAMSLAQALDEHLDEVRMCVSGNKENEYGHGNHCDS